MWKSKITERDCSLKVNQSKTKQNKTKNPWFTATESQVQGGRVPCLGQKTIYGKARNGAETTWLPTYCHSTLSAGFSCFHQHAMARLENRAPGTKGSQKVDTSTRQQVKHKRWVNAPPTMWLRLCQKETSQGLQKTVKRLGSCFKGSEHSCLFSVPFMCTLKEQRCSISTVGFWVRPRELLLQNYS